MILHNLLITKKIKIAVNRDLNEIIFENNFKENENRQ